jgi:peptidoglycan/xylan/chitin deacetylase (PgdA/CDA1 family)
VTASQVTRNARAAVRRGAGALGSRADDRLPRFRARLVRGLTVFVFHEVTEAPSEYQHRTDGFVRPETLRRQIEWMGERFQFVAPTALPALGGDGELPESAALVTFDDAWAGVFRTGLPILAELGVPALCFLNTATVAGEPDLSAVRRFERLRRRAEPPLLPRRVDTASAPAVLARIRAAYGDDPEFAAFQGPTATTDDLAAVGPGVWLGSHLHHHWALDAIDPELFAESLLASTAALAPYANALPTLSTPYGDDAPWLETTCAQLGVPTVFVSSGRQNLDGSAPILDRVALEPEPSGPRDWWYSTQRRRLVGSLAS